MDGYWLDHEISNMHLQNVHFMPTSTKHNRVKDLNIWCAWPMSSSKLPNMGNNRSIAADGGVLCCSE